MGHIRIGISGWRYTAFRKRFYPEGLPQRRELEFAAQHFDSIEINGSFYSLQSPELYERWSAATPPGFVFAVKGSRFITHMKRLSDVRAPLANFFASGVLRLEQKLGPILWQFPERFGFDPERFNAFAELLPRDTREAGRLAEQHDARVRGRSSTEVTARRPIRHAFEVRSASHATPEFVEFCRRHRLALVVADTAGRFPYFEDVTADFVYVRLHGDTELYASGYSPEALARWARRIRAWNRGGEPADAVRLAERPKAAARERDVYVYFDNDAKVHAPFDAIALKSRLDRARGGGVRSRSPHGHAGGNPLKSGELRWKPAR